MGDTGSQDRTDTIDTPITGFHVWRCKSTVTRSSLGHTINNSIGSCMEKEILDNLLHSSTSLGRSETEKMHPPEDISAHFSYTPSNMFLDMSADFESSSPLIPKINADPNKLMALKGEKVVNSPLLIDCAQLPSLQPNNFSGSALMPSTSNMHTTDTSVLPQKVCFICGDEASGYHYGVLSCESCKVFFRRAFKGHQKYLCAGRNDCIVDKIRRKNCSACRLRKCYQAGMRPGDQKLNKKSQVHKPMVLPQSLSAPPAWGLSYNRSAMAPYVPTTWESKARLQIIGILEKIEPEIMPSGYDNSQPDLPHLLSTFNRLYEFELQSIVTWAKSLPGFRSLPVSDQMCLIQYSGMNLMLLSLGWRSFKNVTKEYLYFAPDLVMNEQRMRQSPISDLCVAMQLIPCEFVNLQITKEEYLCLKALTLFNNTAPADGLKNQEQFETMRQNYIQELTKVIQLKESASVLLSQRFYHLMKLVDSIHEKAKMMNLYCASVFIQADALQVEFPKMMTEVFTSMFPKLLDGMVKSTFLP
ncbi:progesterone receptor-like [Arapaima gigas]